MIKFLLPLLAAISLIFLFALLIQGFAPLWETNLGSGLVLWLQACILFSVNAVYQGDVDERPYPLWIHRLVYCGIAILPIYSVVALYGLLTRIAQYGLTVQRCWAVLVAVLLFFFAVGYLWGIIRKQDHWLETLASVNTRMGLFIMGMMILVNSPVANFQALSSQNQMARLQAGTIDISELDLNYFRFSLGRQGYLALQDVKKQYADSNPRLSSQIDSIYRNFNGFIDAPLDTLEDLVTVWPTGKNLPEAVLKAAIGQNPFQNVNETYYAVFVEMSNPASNNNNNREEIIFIRESEGYNIFQLWFFENDTWQTIYLNTTYQSQDMNIETILELGEFSVLAPQWNDIEFGGIRISVPQTRLYERFNISPP